MPLETIVFNFLFLDLQLKCNRYDHFKVSMASNLTSLLRGDNGALFYRDLYYALFGALLKRLKMMMFFDELSVDADVIFTRMF